jgi:hypothetical protein
MADSRTPQEHLDGLSPLSVKFCINALALSTVLGTHLTQREVSWQVSHLEPCSFYHSHCFGAYANDVKSDGWQTARLRF